MRFLVRWFARPARNRCAFLPLLSSPRRYHIYFELFVRSTLRRRRLSLVEFRSRFAFYDRSCRFPCVRRRSSPTKLFKVPTSKDESTTSFQDHRRSFRRRPLKRSFFDVFSVRIHTRIGFVYRSPRPKPW